MQLGNACLVYFVDWQCPSDVRDSKDQSNLCVAVLLEMNLTEAISIKCYKIVWIWRVCSRSRLPILNFRVQIIRLCILTIAIGKIEFILLYNKHLNTLTGVIKSYSLNKASPVTVPVIMCSCWKRTKWYQIKNSNLLNKYFCLFNLTNM